MVVFIDDIACKPSFKIEEFQQLSEGNFIFISGEWWWSRADLRVWIIAQKEQRHYKIGLLLCMMEQVDGFFDICDTVEEKLGDGVPELNYLGIWPQLVRLYIYTCHTDIRKRVWCRNFTKAIFGSLWQLLLRETAG